MNQELEVIAGRINELHRHSTESAEDAVDFAIQCGLELIQAKRRIGHGKFLFWLGANFKGSQQTASIYMRIALNYAHVGNLPPDKKPESIRRALHQICSPNDEKSVLLSELEKANRFMQEYEAKREEAELLEHIDFNRINDIGIVQRIIEKAQALELWAARHRVQACRESERLLNEMTAVGLSLEGINDLNLEPMGTGKAS